MEFLVEFDIWVRPGIRSPDWGGAGGGENAAHRYHLSWATLS
jgi:hypothetical protein